VHNQIINLKDFWEFTPGSGSSKGTWKRIADLPGDPRLAAVGFGLGQKGYVTTGIGYMDNTHYTWYKDVWEYDPNTNPKTGGKWTQKEDFPGAARAYAVGFSINNAKGYVGTGNTPGAGNTGLKKDFWEYDPGNTETGPWTQKADFAGVARDLDVGFSIGNKGYIGTGLINVDVLIQDFWQFDPGTSTGPGTWLQKADFGMHRTVLKDGDAIENPFPASNDELTVYPNPSGSTFNFRLNSASHEPVNIRVFDIMGRMVHEYSSLSPDEIISVGDNLNAGVYIAVVTQGEFRKSVKINKVN
jgi:N-acetylneuraminic acid mutarotase